MKHPFAASLLLILIVLNRSLSARSATAIADDTIMPTNGVANSDNLTMVISWDAGDPASIKDKFIFYFNTRTNDYERVFIPRNLSYFCELQLVTEAGKPVPMTQLGQSCGKYFNEMKRTYSGKHQKLFEKMQLNRGTSVREVSAPTASQYLNGPFELFQIKETGNYTLIGRFQVLRLGQSGAESVFERVRFPELRYTFEYKGK